MTIHSKLNWARKPNFFVVGAPKCGTTSMHHYLKQHPDIFMPDEKELHFFGSDLGYTHKFRDEELYQRVFDGWTQEKRGGEASVWYMYSQNAAREIHEFNPDAKIIIHLRSPADMVHACHAQAMYVGVETITEFDAALAAEDGRRNGDIPTDPAVPKQLYYYREVARYPEQIERFYNFFGKERVHINLMDDLKQDTDRVFRDTLEFLDVDPDVEAVLEPRNRNRRYRVKGLHYLLTKPAPRFRRAVKRLFPTSVWRSVKTSVQKWNTSTRPRDPMSSETRRKLNLHYEPEIQRLSDMIGRDLTHWTKG